MSQAVRGTGVRFTLAICFVTDLYKATQKTGTFEMRSGSHVQLAALRNRDLELQSTSPFSNHGSLERSTACCRHKILLDFFNFFGPFKSSRFCVTLYKNFEVIIIIIIIIIMIIILAGPSGRAI
jgi:hypothetical protein